MRIDMNAYDPILEEVYADRADSKSLIDQMIDGIKAAVASGRYKPGEKLPSVRALAELAGVSLIVPRMCGL